MKRFLIFTGSTYYPSGGIADLIGSAETLSEAVEVLRLGDITLDEFGIVIGDLFSFAHVYDVKEERIALGMTDSDVGRIRSDLDYLYKYGISGYLRGRKSEPSVALVSLFRREYDREPPE